MYPIVPTGPTGSPLTVFYFLCTLHRRTHGHCYTRRKYFSMAGQFLSTRGGLWTGEMFVKHGNEVADGYIYTCAIAACSSVSLQEKALLLLEELAATWLQSERGTPKCVSGPIQCNWCRENILIDLIRGWGWVSNTKLRREGCRHSCHCRWPLRPALEDL